MPFQRLKQALALSLVALLAACGSAPTAGSPGAGGHLLTVRLEAGDTQEAVTQRYGGELLLWTDERAVLKMSGEAVAQMQARGVSMQNTTLETNSVLSTPMASALGTGASGWNAWSSGWNAWSSGWNAWSSGWNAWSSGGTVPALPAENNTIWTMMQLRQAHALAKNYGSGIKVAVIDTGIDLNHPMFVGRLAPSTEWKDYVDGDTTPQEVNAGTTPSAFGHGTGVAGIILQVAPKATILPIRVLSPNGSGSLDNVIAAINHAIARGAKVINLSLGASGWSDALVAALGAAVQNGVYVPSAVGNNGQQEGILFPAIFSLTEGAYPYVMGVGSFSRGSQLSPFSAYGSTFMVGAVGEGVVSAYPGGQIAQYTGTSFATPLVSGVLALTLSETTDATVRADLMNRLLRTLFTNDSLNRSIASGRLPAGTTYFGSGNGMVDAANLLRSLPTFVEPTSTATNLASANPGFESTSGGWTYSGGAARTTSGQRSGKAAGSLGAGRIASTTVAVSPNTSYTVTAWLRFPSTAAGDAALFGLEERSSSNTLLGKTETTVNPFTTSYSSRSVTLTTGPSTSSLTLYFQRAGGSGAILIDDVRLVRN
ncbi:MAG: S8 family serine peptidase [Meiothermus sp.]|nr:S8 family serine peptidase [Meiothermus sp.]